MSKKVEIPAIEGSVPKADQEMSLWEHLEDLRWTVVRAVIGIIVGMILCGIFFDQITAWVITDPTSSTTPPMKLMNTEVYGQLSVWMQIVMWGGIIVSFPYTLIQIWKFIAPGLHEKEKANVAKITFFTILSFLCGMAFAYYVMLPMVLSFAMGFVIGTVTNMIEVHKYLSVFLEIILLSGIVFELPLIAYFLGRMGILTATFMRHYRRHAIVMLLAIAAVLSPGGNPLLQLILFGPLWALFEISILGTALAVRQRRKNAASTAS
ncbi:MAG: twin-arginine translocase subunit TatC [Bacteroidota bacterium]|nr:twin-arginine translocase subunit TatC [Bacteroidota bacterium]MDP4233296.1 twin-arginine translocase subunit TatC [Bacteroidota bacterium]MDP4242084.1 twin-arginine translocase subunit TatC [Bacteroidota bacterium]MDP4288637.1 twin-arginine translocase subunit TatC [Bacteroidota bacterium]